jgi:hypothetical protein
LTKEVEEKSMLAVWASSLKTGRLEVDRKGHLETFIRFETGPLIAILNPYGFLDANEALKGIPAPQHRPTESEKRRGRRLPSMMGTSGALTST